MASSFVQGKGNVNLGGTSVVVTLDGAVAAGNLLVGFLYYADSAGTLSISDTVNGSWPAQILQQFRPSNDRRIAAFAFENSAAGTPTITGSTTGTSNVIAIVVCEVTGVLTSGALSQQASASGTSATPSSGTLTPAGGFEFFVGGAFADANTWSLGSGYSNLILDNSTPGSQREAMESRRHNAADAVTFSITSSQWACIGLTFSESAVGSPFPGSSQQFFVRRRA